MLHKLWNKPCSPALYKNSLHKTLLGALVFRICCRHHNFNLCSSVSVIDVLSLYCIKFNEGKNGLLNSILIFCFIQHHNFVIRDIWHSNHTVFFFPQKPNWFFYQSKWRHKFILIIIGFLIIKPWVLDMPVVQRLIGNLPRCSFPSSSSPWVGRKSLARRIESALCFFY